MVKIVVAGIGTEVGKSVASAILTTKLKGIYWKPVQCGLESDTAFVEQMGGETYPSTYTFKAPLSPHHAARLEEVEVDLDAIIPPVTTRPLIIEGAGGLLVPLTLTSTSCELFLRWQCKWVVVVRHYLGSINHTLLTLEALKQRGANLLGVIFNGAEAPDSESAILAMTKLPVIGRLLPEPYIDKTTIERYAKQWNVPW